MKPLRIDLHEGSREEISLFLIVSLQNNPVAADDEGFESLDDLFLRQDRSLHPGLDLFYTPPLLIASRRPGTRNRL